jgi:methyl-accepting chemotaxis protein
MFDSSGIVLAHPEQAKIMTMNVSTTDFGHYMLTQGAGSLQYEFEGSKKVAHFRRAQKKAWTIVATEPNSEFLAGVRTIQLYLIVFGFLMLGVTVFAVLIISGKVSRTINDVVSELSGSSEQFVSAASQISQTSQSVAQGASQQAASIQETSSAAEEVTAATRENKARTAALAGVMKEAGASFHVMDECMDQLVRWMTDFKHSSEKVSKIVKAIDEIAFQTNILALNAAVEAIFIRSTPTSSGLPNRAPRAMPRSFQRV